MNFGFDLLINLCERVSKKDHNASESLFATIASAVSIFSNFSESLYQHGYQRPAIIAISIAFEK